MTTTITWGHDALWSILLVDGDGRVRVAWLAADPPPVGSEHKATSQPLVEIVTADDGLTPTNARYSDTPLGRRLRYRSHEQTARDGWHELTVVLTDEVTGLETIVRWTSPSGIPVVRCTTEITNAGPAPIVVDAVTSLTLGVTDAIAAVEDLELHRARTDWVAESRWHAERLRPWLLPEVDRGEHAHTSRGRLAVTSRGAWSTGTWLPMGAVQDRRTGRSWAWQVEHQGAWSWELGERRDGWYVAASGPTDAEHRWRTTLQPGASFGSVPAALAVATDGIDQAIGSLTRYRRAARRDHPAMRELPVVFNDYMNTLMGDPTTDRLLPLIDAAAEVGAEYFCIDAGWYDDGGDWWDSVGAWEPSMVRFPGGLVEVLDHIRSAGMAPGLWLEPEVVGVRSRATDELPDEAFFCRDGRRIVVAGRYHLDLRHPAAVAHLDAVVDHLVTDLGVGYFKLDYNIDPGAGTDVAAESLGDGLLGHNRAHLAWLDRVIDRHPRLVLENCSSGAMRMDPVLLERFHLQSTTDQQNALLYPPIAASAPMMITPEQAGNWAYPQPEMDAEAIAFTMCTGLAGRLYLSGHLDRMSADQRALVAEGVAAAISIRDDVADAVPFWPLGRPAWEDPWVVLGLRAAATNLLVVWYRHDTSDDIVLELPHLCDHDLEVTNLYPATLPPLATTWDRSGGRLRVTSAGGPVARLIRLTERTGATSAPSDGVRR